MDDLTELLRPHVARIFAAGKRAALAELNGTVEKSHDPAVEKRLDPITHPRQNGKFVAKNKLLPPLPGPLPAASQPAPQQQSPDLSAVVLGAMLLYAGECRATGENPRPGLKHLAGLVHDRERLARVTGQAVATVQKAYWEWQERVWDAGGLVEKAKVWSEEKHPRDANGRWIGVGRIEQARIDPDGYGKELRKPLEDAKAKAEEEGRHDDAAEYESNLKKLAAAVKGDGDYAAMPPTARGKVRAAAHQKRLDKEDSRKKADEIRARLKDAADMKKPLSADDLKELAETHIPNMRVQDLRALRKELIGSLAKKIGWEGAKRVKQMSERLAAVAHAEAARMTAPEPEPKPEAKSAPEPAKPAAKTEPPPAKPSAPPPGKATPAKPDPKAETPGDVLAHHDKATGMAKAALNMALYNAGYLDDDDRPVPGGGDPERLSRQLATSWHQIQDAGATPVEVGQVEAAMRAHGLWFNHAVGDVVPHDRRSQQEKDRVISVSTGSPVRVLRPGVVGKRADGREWLIEPADVEPVARPVAKPVEPAPKVAPQPPKPAAPPSPAKGESERDEHDRLDAMDPDEMTDAQVGRLKTLKAKMRDESGPATAYRDAPVGSAFAEEKRANALKAAVEKKRASERAAKGIKPGEDESDEPLPAPEKKPVAPPPKPVAKPVAGPKPSAASKPAAPRPASHPAGKGREVGMGLNREDLRGWADATRAEYVEQLRKGDRSEKELAELYGKASKAAEALAATGEAVEPLPKPRRGDPALEPDAPFRVAAGAGKMSEEEDFDADGGDESDGPPVVSLRDEIRAMLAGRSAAKPTPVTPSEAAKAAAERLRAKNEAKVAPPVVSVRELAEKAKGKPA